jgi:ribosomal protein S18 acetylase RimI-like enzyme
VIVSAVFEKMIAPHPPAFTIRPIQPGELEAVLEVYRQCEDFLALGPQPEASMDMLLYDMRTSQDAGGSYCGIYSALNDNQPGRLIGILDYVLDGYCGDAGRAYLSLLMIAAPYRGLGLGADVTAWLERQVRKNPAVSVLALSVQVNNPAAIRFWQKMGFQIVSQPESQADTTVVFRMEKVLRGG